MAEIKERFVFDTSAFFTLFENENGADVVQRLLRQASLKELSIFISFVSFTEIFYITYREEGEQESRRRINMMELLPIKRIDSTKELSLIAGELKAKHRISFADSWVAATAVFYNAVLVHKDPEFEQLKDVLSTLKLPYKS